MNSFDSLVWRCIAALMASVALVGCAVAPPEKKPAPPATVFYPSAPEPPRIQHLATFVGERDFDADRSDFAKFVAGEAAGQQMQQVYGVALAGGRLYAVDTKGAGVAIFDLVEQKFSVFSGSGGGRMKSPINLTIDVDGTKYVTDTGRDQVLVYDRDNRFVSAFGEPQQFRPVDTAVVGERLYVVDIQHHQVHVLDKRSGKPLFKFGQPGSKEGDLYHPTNIAVGPDGDIFVTETSNFRVQRFTAEGKFVRVYGQVGDRPGSFARPKGIAIDRAGRIYVGDAAFQNVQVFENDGRLLMAFGQPKDGQGLSLPAGVAIDYDNVALFKRYADPKFEVEYLIVVASQIAPNKVDVFGFGRMGGVDYDRAPPAAKR
jgi:sugar lactone lactonase YvrE